MPRPFPNLIGMRFGRLTVLEKVVRPHRSLLRCACECGRETLVAPFALNGGNTRSCGCLAAENIEKAIATRRIHGHATGGKTSRTYRSWRAMIQRTEDVKSREWEHYGGRGIVVCSHWRNSFEVFLRDMGRRPDNKTLDRINNELGYLCPLCLPPAGNCRWSTMSEQLKNQRHEIFHEKRSIAKTNWWMSQSAAYRHQRAIDAARRRWGG